MADYVAAYVIAISMGGVLFVAVMARRALIDSTSVTLYRVIRSAGINSRKGKIMPGGVVLPLGPEKQVRGHQKIFVVYYGLDRAKEAKTGTKFWVRRASLGKCSRPEVVPLEQIAPSPPPPKANPTRLPPPDVPQRHSHTAQEHLERAESLHAWRR